MVVLPIIFPKADAADFKTSASTQGLAATARAAIGLLFFVSSRYVFKHAKKFTLDEIG
jgi:hypothetical protein